MAEFALVGPGDVIKTTSNNVDPTVSTRAGWRWLPVVETNPAFDSVTQVSDGPVITVLADQVTRVWTVRAKTAPEISADKDAAVNNALNNNAYSVLLKIILNLHNRVRVLEGQPTQTMAQLKAAIKALL